MSTKRLIRILVVGTLVLPAMAVDAMQSSVTSWNNEAIPSSIFAQQDFNAELVNAVRSGADQVVIELLNKVKLDQVGINQAFMAVHPGQQALVKWWLGLPEGKRPDSYSIMEVYRRAIASGDAGLANIIEPYVSPKERRQIHELDRRIPQYVSEEPHYISSDALEELRNISAGAAPPYAAAQVTLPKSSASAVAVASSNYVMSDAERTELERLQREFDKGSADRVFLEAAKKDYRSIMAWMLSLPKGQGRPTISGINRAFIDAASAGQQAIMAWMLSLPIGQGRPDKYYGVDEAFAEAASNGQQAMMVWMLNFPKRQGRPNPYGVNLAFFKAARTGQQAIMVWMLSADRPIRPDQYAINRAFSDAASNGQQTIMVWMLSLPEGQGRPDQNGIIYTYRNVVANGNDGLIRMLAPYVSLEERQNHGLAAGGATSGFAFEIHNYANTKVKLPQSSASAAMEMSAASSATSAPKQIKLIDAVFDYIIASLKNVPLISYSDSQKLIIQAIDTYIPEGQRNLAKKAALHRLSCDINYEQQICLVVTFMKIFHQDKMQQWIEGFVRESIEAYINSSNPTSCSKGIRERTATGLRGIDTGLDKIFAQAEGPMLFRNWLKRWNLKRSNDEDDDSRDNKRRKLSHESESQKELAMELEKEGITGRSSADDVANAFKRLANQQLQLNGMSLEQGAAFGIEEYAALVEEEYANSIKPYIDSKAEVSSDDMAISPRRR